MIWNINDWIGKTVMFRQVLAYPCSDSRAEYTEPVVILRQSELGDRWLWVEGKIMGKCNVSISLLELPEG